jgi:hypothetical protein
VPFAAQSAADAAYAPSMKRTAVVSVTGDSGRGVSLAKKNAVGAVVAATAAAAASLDSPESGNGAAPYEHERNARIAEKKQTMHALGIGKPAAEIAAAKVEGKSEKKKQGSLQGWRQKQTGSAASVQTPAARVPTPLRSRVRSRAPEKEDQGCGCKWCEWRMIML